MPGAATAELVQGKVVCNLLYRGTTSHILKLKLNFIQSQQCNSEKSQKSVTDIEQFLYIGLPPCILGQPVITQNAGLIKVYIDTIHRLQSTYAQGSMVAVHTEISN